MEINAWSLWEGLIENKVFERGLRGWGRAVKEGLPQEKGGVGKLWEKGRWQVWVRCIWRSSSHISFPASESVLSSAYLWFP